MIRRGETAIARTSAPQAVEEVQMQNVHISNAQPRDDRHISGPAFIGYVPDSKEPHVVDRQPMHEVRGQAAKSSAAARKATILRRVAEKANVPLEQRPLKPNNKANASLVFDAGRAQLWHQILNDQSLYQATLLTMAAGLSVKEINAFFAADLSYVQHGALIAKSHALNQVRKCVSRGRSRQAAAAIALLASLAFKSGDVESYNAHMQAWRAVCSASGICGTGVEEAHVLTLSDAVFDAVSRGVKTHAPPLAKMLTVSQQQGEHEVSELQSGFLIFESERQKVRKLLEIATQFARSILNAETLRFFHLSSIGWQHPKGCTINDPLAAVAIHSTWVLLPVLATRVALVPPYSDRQVFDVDDAAGVQFMEHNFRSMQLELLLGTAFEDMLLWLVCSMCAISALVHQRCYRILRSIMITRSIDAWAQLESILRMHLYRRELNEDYTALFEALKSRFAFDDGSEVWPSRSMRICGRALVISDSSQ